MKTNFDAWRDSLTPDELFVFSILHDAEMPHLRCDKNCPAAKTCPVVRSFAEIQAMRKRGEYIPKRRHDRHRELGKDCKRWFKTWAFSPAKEEASK